MTGRFILTEQFNGLQGVSFVKDECIDVDTYYTVDGAVDLLNELADENEQLKERNQELFDDLQYKTSLLSLRGGELAILKRENEQLKQPHCRKCSYFSCDNADSYCMKKEFDSIDDFNIAKNCKDYESVF